MKKLLTILASIFITCQCFAHGEVQIKASCTWGWQYKAKARVNHFTGIGATSQLSCFPCVQASRFNHCATQFSSYCNGVINLTGGVSTHYGHCGRGYALTPMMERLFKPLFPPPGTLSPRDSLNNTEKSDLTITPVSQTATSYKIKINGTMQIIGSEPSSEIELLVWKPKHILGLLEDTIIDKDEILWRAFAKIVEGRLILEDNFVGDRMIFQSASNQNQNKFRFEPRVMVIEGPNGPELCRIGECPGPPNIIHPTPPTVSVTTLRFANFEKTLTWSSSEVKDSLVIVLRSHSAGPEAGGRIMQSMQNTELSNDVKFDVFPNPATTSFDIKFMSVTDANAEINIFNELGEMVTATDKKYLAKEQEYQSHFNTETLGMSKGVYFISLEIDGKMYLRKIVITGK